MSKIKQAPVNIVLQVHEVFRFEPIAQSGGEGVNAPLMPSPFELNVVGEIVSPPHLAGQMATVRYAHVWAIGLQRKMDAAVADAERRNIAVEAAVASSMTQGEVESLRLAHALVGDITRKGYLQLFYACDESEKRSKNGGLIFYSRFAEAIGHPSDRAVMHGLCRVNLKKGVNGAKNKAHVDVIFPEKARRIDVAEDLQIFFKDYLPPVIDDLENNANCLFRVIAPKTREVVLAWVFVSREIIHRPGPPGRPARVFSQPGSLEKTWNEAITTGAQSDGLPRVIASALGLTVEPMSRAQADLAAKMAQDLAMGDIVIEAIPGRRLRVVGDSLVRIFEPGSRLHFAAMNCISKEDGGDSLRFIPMTVCLTLSRPGGPDAALAAGRAAVVAKLAPDTHYTHYKTRELATANYEGHGGSSVALKAEDFEDQPPPGFRDRNF